MTIICLEFSYEVLSFNKLKPPALMPEIFSYCREPPELARLSPMLLGNHLLLPGSTASIRGF